MDNKERAFDSIEEEGEVFQVIIESIRGFIFIDASGAYTGAVVVTPQTAREIAAYLVKLADDIENNNAT